MRIHWIVSGVEGDAESGYRSTLASNRYRAILPAQGLRALGHEVDLLDLGRWAKGTEHRPDAVVIGKLLAGGSPDEFRSASLLVRERMKALLAAGVPVLADFNDDHFDHPVMGEHWRETARLASACTVGSEAMASAVNRHTAAPTVVIGDPIGSLQRAPRVFRRPRGLSTWLSGVLPGQSASRLKLVWYGNPVNWPAMAAWLEKLQPLAKEQPFLVWIITRPHPAIEEHIERFNARHGPSAIATFIPWDEEAQWSVVNDADVVLIPSDPTEPKKTVKTANRLTDALNAGRFVVASPLPAYQPFESFVALTDDPLAAIRRYLEAPDACLQQVQAGQGAAQLAGSVSTVGRQWQAALQDAVQSFKPAIEPAAVSGTQSPIVRLNLGCGDKILAGYVNVDVVAARAGRKPDVLCDLHDLRVFDSGSADEVLAVHVVEHFWRWEVEAILREWVRVLKPGGKMVLECPNLLSACEELLQKPEVASAADAVASKTMWVLYGDPSWKDPYMMHRWAYTPHSLGELMRSVGLEQVRQEKAQFKMREPRDMRMVGTKPAS